MIHLFMDNFRGFENTLIPLRQVTFLVGENSTGKSSFLSLLHLLSSIEFWIKNDFSPTECCDLGGFRDIASAGSQVKKHFTVGQLETSLGVDDQGHSKNECSFALMSFGDDDGLPRLARYMEYCDGELVKLRASKNKVLFKHIEMPIDAPDHSGFADAFLDVFHSDASDTTGFRTLQREVPMPVALPYVVTMLPMSATQRKKRNAMLFRKLPLIRDLTSLAPIRTKPKRTYDGFKTNFTPEGAHTPHVIRKALKSREKADGFARMLKRFGDSSGLFTSVNAHSFGQDPAAPFEVLVELAGHKLNVSNVGYGVSQVLPVVVEMLTARSGLWCAIQQPEIHLHPKAQAALGEIMHFLAYEKGHNYVVETHSDYLIDRFRLGIKQIGKPDEAQVVFFRRTANGNEAHILELDAKGRYPEEQPKEFRDFFIHHELSLLEM